MARRAAFFVGLMVGVVGGCTAETLSPPLSPKLVGENRTFSGVSLTSGTFARPMRVIGVIQLTQAGYKWFHEVEVIDDANPASLLYKIGAYARAQGADGVQHLELLDLNPQTPGEKAYKQVESAARWQRQLARGQQPDVAEEGTKTRWEVKGELVQFVDLPHPQ